MKIVEILDKAVDYSVTDRTKTFFQAEFVSNGRIIKFDADLEYDYTDADDEAAEQRGVWAIAFVQKDPRGGPGRWDVTKGGKEFEVFATIRKIIEEFINEYDPKKIKFTSDKDESNRGQLYYKLFSKLLPPGYSLKKDDSSSRVWDKFEVVKN
jgi:hypothetical protein